MIRALLYTLAALILFSPTNNVNAAEDVLYISPKKAYEKIQNNPDIIVLDIRTPREFKRDRIQGAININYYALNFRDKIKELDPEKTYLVHCAAGYRSKWSINALKESGLKNIIHMDHGLNQWREQGLPLVMAN